MAVVESKIQSPYFTPQLINGIYIPSGLIIMGTAIVKMEWLAYAVVITALLAAIKLFRTRKCLDRVGYCCESSPLLTRMLKELEKY
jgi:hypothetical protein